MVGKHSVLFVRDMLYGVYYRAAFKSNNLTITHHQSWMLVINLELFWFGLRF